MTTGGTPAFAPAFASAGLASPGLMSPAEASAGFAPAAFGSTAGASAGLASAGFAVYAGFGVAGFVGACNSSSAWNGERSPRFSATW